MAKEIATKKSTINVFYKDGKRDVIPGKLWDDYEYLDRMFVVKNKSKWVCFYNMDNVEAIVVDLVYKKKKKKK